MEYLKSSTYWGMVAVTFTVAATFQIGLALVGLIFAVVAPGVFKTNDAPAGGPIQAIGVILFMLLFGMVMNITISAGGAALWLLLRRWVRRPPAAA